MNHSTYDALFATGEINSATLAAEALSKIAPLGPDGLRLVVAMTDPARHMVEPTRELWTLVDLIEIWLLRAERQGVDASVDLAADHLTGLAQAIRELAARGAK